MREHPHEAKHVAHEVTPQCEFNRGLRSKTGPRSQESKGAGEKEEGEAAFSKGRDHTKGIVTGRNERLETTAREQKGERVVYDCIAQRGPLEVVSLAEAR